ncbi:MAG: hypothetical protein LBP75_08500 [Planctomycetota bacterium]|jgi:hypothetical protein|nr:hypothetical protein [Planctomycetota bacterium]
MNKISELWLAYWRDQTDRLIKRIGSWRIYVDIAEVKRLFSGWLEKISVGAVIAAIFQGQTSGLIVAVISILLAFALILRKERK